MALYCLKTTSVSVLIWEQEQFVFINMLAKNKHQIVAIGWFPSVLP